MKDTKVMRHTLVALRPGQTRTHVVGCYPRPEYWRIVLYVVATADPEQTIEVEMISDERVYASQMATVVTDQWRIAAAEIGTVADAWFDLYRISPERHAQLLDERLARVLETGVAA